MVERKITDRFNASRNGKISGYLFVLVECRPSDRFQRGGQFDLREYLIDRLTGFRGEPLEDRRFRKAETRCTTRRERTRGNLRNAVHGQLVTAVGFWVKV